MAELGVNEMGGRLRVLITRGLARFGLGEGAFLVLAAVLIGVVTAGAAVAFHELIGWLRTVLYERLNERVNLYGAGIYMLVVLPAAGGLAVGLVTNYIVRVREGRGIIDVLEAVMRSRGVINPVVAIEKIVTAGITIGTGGSAGAEGPIVQIGASIASAIGQIFRVVKPAMPVLIGCGSAAGISAIFNSPIGGVLFTLEVILQDFSIRTFTPVVMASVVANITTQAIFRKISKADEYHAIFALPDWIKSQHMAMGWDQVVNFILLGLFCGAVGVLLIRLMYRAEKVFDHWRVPRAIKPMIGGLLVGLMGAGYVMVFGWWMMGRGKPFLVGHYPMPAFFGDGYGVIRQLLDSNRYSGAETTHFLILIAALIGIKIIATCLTLGSGGSGGIIAPSLFLGATCGATLGMLLKATGWFADIQPEMYALVGMAAVLGAVVHAPLAGILILFDVTRDDKVMLPAMLATISATGFARLLFKDSIYTLALRQRGVHVGGGAMTLLQRMTVEQVALEPASVVDIHDPLEKVIQLVVERGVVDIVAVDEGLYAGMITAHDIQTVLWEREAIPLLAVADLLRSDIAVVKTTDDLAYLMDVFARHDVGRLAVCLPSAPGRVIGLVSRVGLMKRYREGGK